MEWWKFLDRDAVIEAARGLIPGGGCLVLQGDDDSGRMEALDLVEWHYEQMGWATVRVGATEHLSTVRSVMLAIWRALPRAADPAGLGPWAAAANLSVGFLSEQVGAAVAAAGVALAVEDVDHDQAIPDSQAPAFSRLAEFTRGPVVLASRTSTRWPDDNAGLATLQLGGFAEEDVRRCLVTRPELSSRHVSEFDEALRLVRDPEGGILPPAQSYMRLASWSHE